MHNVVENFFLIIMKVLYLVKNAFKMNKVFFAYDLMIRNKGSEKEEKGEGRKAMSSEEAAASEDT